MAIADIGWNRFLNLSFHLQSLGIVRSQRELAAESEKLANPPTAITIETQALLDDRGSTHVR